MMMSYAADMLLAFVGTNLDNFIVISIMLAASGEWCERIRIVSSQFIGLAVLVCISLMGTELLRLLPMQYTRFLGFLPMIIGVRGLMKAGNEMEGGDEGKIPSLLTLIMLNLSGGMDNISVYIPLFERFSGWQTLVLLGTIFAGMMAVWCFLAGKVALLPFVRERIRRHSAVLVPMVYILLGVYILLR